LIRNRIQTAFGGSSNPGFGRPVRRLLGFATLVLIAAIALSACGSSGGDSTGEATTSNGGSSSTAANSGGGEQSFSIAYFSPLASNAYIAAFGKGLEEAAAELGAEVTVYNANGDPGQQASQIAAATTAGDFDGFVIIPITPAVIPSLTKAHGQGILTVCAINICGKDPVAVKNENPDVVTTQFAISIAEQQEMQVEAIVKACEGIDPCNIVYIPGNTLDPRTSTRIKLLEEGIAEHPSINLLSDEQSGESNVAKAQNAASNLLATYPEMEVMVCDTDQCGLGAETALKGAGKLEKIKLISGGGAEEAIEKVESGAWYADSYPELPGRSAKESTTALVEALEGKTVPATILAKSEPRVLYQDNVSGFEADWSAR
jgi:ribose transport system substrate-binding protein